MRLLSIFFVAVLAFGASKFELATKAYYINGAKAREAAKLYASACHDERSAVGCLMAARIINSTPGLDFSEYQMAHGLVQRACELGDEHGCAQLGDLYQLGVMGGEEHIRLALSAYTKACDAQITAACTSLAHIYYRGGKGVQKQMQTASKLYKFSCERRDSQACEGLAELGDELGRRDKARKFYKLACELGSQTACFKAR